MKWQGSPPFTQIFSFDFTAIFYLNFLKPTLVSFGYYASACMIASMFNKSPNYLIAEAPSNPPLILPFKCMF